MAASFSASRCANHHSGRGNLPPAPRPRVSFLGFQGSDSGCIISKANTCVVVGIYGVNQPAGQCVNVVERLVEYFISIGM